LTTGDHGGPARRRRLRPRRTRGLEDRRYPLRRGTYDSRSRPQGWAAPRPVLVIHDGMRSPRPGATMWRSGIGTRRDRFATGGRGFLLGLGHEYAGTVNCGSPQPVWPGVLERMSLKFRGGMSRPVLRGRGRAVPRRCCWRRSLDAGIALRDEDIPVRTLTRGITGRKTRVGAGIKASLLLLVRGAHRCLAQQAGRRRGPAEMIAVAAADWRDFVSRGSGDNCRHVSGKSHNLALGHLLYPTACGGDYRQGC